MNAQTPVGPFVRPAIPDDAEGIAKVHVKGWQEAYVGQLRTWAMAGRPRMLSPPGR